METISEDPQKYGLPAKFVKWNQSQKELIEFVLNSDKKYVVLNAPTGVGKSLCALALANIMNERTYIVVGTKNLQDQYELEFASLGVRTIKGKSNFPCVIEPGLTAEHCKFEALTGNARSCPAYKQCPYFVQRDEAKKSRIVIMNYAYFIPALNYTEGWGRAGLLVFDETDTAEGWLANAVKIRFSYRDFSEFGLRFPGSSQDEVRVILDELGKIAGDRLVDLKKKKTEEATQVELQQIKKCKSLLSRLKLFHENYEVDWIFTHSADRDQRFWFVEWEPVWAKKFGQMLWSHGDKVVFMSATPGAKDEFCFKLGLNPEEVDYIEVPSPFAIENRKIVYWPVADMSMKYFESNKRQLLTAIDSIIEERLDQKGIVHCTSYSMAKDIARMSKFAPYIILTDVEDNKTETLARFKKSNPPAILVSPSFTRGVDLPDDDARYAIIAKVLYPDLGEERVRRRLEERPSWYPAQTCDNIVQASGRIVRSSTDWGTTFILDTQFERLFHQNQNLLPFWFLEAVYRWQPRSTDERI